MDYSDEDDERRGENDDMDDLGEDESDEEESDNDDDEEDENDDGIESEEEEEVHDESVHKFIRTFHNGDYDNRFDEALSSDRSAVVPNTRPTQASYNKPNNWIQINRLGLMNLQEQLQTCIDSVTRDNSFNLLLRHNRQENWEMPIVWHAPFSIVNDYWDELEEAIDRKKNATDIRVMRTQKILLALNGKDSLLKYLTNVPVELIPEVFAFPHGRQPVYLDLVYSTMRWWNMPLLYSYYICVKSATKRKREMTV
jgi:hypothetical protein